MDQCSNISPPLSHLSHSMTGCFGHAPPPLFSQPMHATMSPYPPPSPPKKKKKARQTAYPVRALKHVMASQAQDYGRPRPLRLRPRLGLRPTLGLVVGLGLVYVRLRSRLWMGPKLGYTQGVGYASIRNSLASYHTLIKQTNTAVDACINVGIHACIKTSGMMNCEMNNLVIE